MRYTKGGVNFFDNTNNNFYLTGVQVEVGSKATDFDYRSYGEELLLCQRYFVAILHDLTSGVNYHVFPVNFESSTGNNGHIAFTVALPTVMRALPTFTHTLANSNHSGSGVSVTTTTWNFYRQNQGWGGYAGNGNMNTLSRAPSGPGQIQLGTYWISPGATNTDQLAIGKDLRMDLSAEL